MAETCNVAQHLTISAQNNPEQCAVITPRNLGGHQLSLAELEVMSQGAVALFAEKGIQRRTRVLLMARPGIELIVSVFALFKLGAPPVVIDPGMGLKGFLRCVKHAQPEALVGIPLAHRVSRFFPKSFRSVRNRVTLNRRFLDSAKAAVSNAPKPAETKADELAAILFTSGSTGPAKGVCYEHGMFEAQVRMLREHFAIQPGEIDLPMLPIFALFNPALGMTTIVPEMNPSRPAKADPAKIVSAIHQHQVTNSFGSPVLWTKIASHCETTGKALPSLKRVLMAGAPCPPALIRRLKALMPNGEVHTPYGATEVLPVSSISGTEILEYSAKLTEQGKGTCVGVTLPGVTAKIIAINDDPIDSIDAIRELPQGVIGEILVTGPSVT
ncbi:MAG: AMP-binding protein, partial [Puniceicoccales bacterium]